MARKNHDGSGPTASTAAPPPKEKLGDFYQQLELLLRQQLDRQPDLQDVRLKLLELYYEMRRPEDFLRAARTLRHAIREPGKSREWQRIASMGRMLVPGEALFSGHASDTIEFIAETEMAPIHEEPKKFRRFGDDDRFRPLFDELGALYEPVRKDAGFLAEFELLLANLPTRRPTPMIPARRLSKHIGGAQIFIKREDFAGDNPHLVIAACGQALLARRLGRKTLVTGTADGRRGVATAVAAARLGLHALVFMDSAQAERASVNTSFLKLLGAELQLVKASRYRGGDVREAALAHWAKHPAETFLLAGLDALPAPYPIMTQEFTATIGRECRRQMTGRPPPDIVVARGAHTADALGLFPAFLGERGTRLVCVDAENRSDETADLYKPGSQPLTSSERKVARNILDRLEYPSVAREHALFKASGRVEYVQTARDAARTALQDLARLEGVITPIETAHVFAWACEAAKTMKRDQSVIVMMAEPLDKDVWDIKRLVEPPAAS